MKNGKGKRPKPDYKEVRPPLETKGEGFNEVLKRLSNTKPEEVKALEAQKATKSGG